MACWISRSITVGIPSCLTPPSGLGISTRRTGLGRYVQPVLLQIAAQFLHFHPIDPCRSLVALNTLQCGLQVLSLEHCFPYASVGFSFVSCRGCLGAPLASRRLHLLRVCVSPSIRGFLPSLFIPLLVQPFPKKNSRHYTGTHRRCGAASADSCHLGLMSGLPG